jgi:hypothetical protein
MTFFVRKRDAMSARVNPDARLPNWCPPRVTYENKKIFGVVFAIFALLSLVVFALTWSPTLTIGHFKWLFLGTSIFATLVSGILFCLPKKVAQQRMSARTIKSIDEIPNMTAINGVPIETIERRARPCTSAGGILTEDHVEGESYTGFLGKEESLKDVLLQDWQTVRNLGLTHIQIADHLEYLMNQAKQSKGWRVELTYTIPGYERQNLRVVYVQTKGIQSDIFRPEGEEGAPWGDECIILNQNTGDRITHCASGTIRYIRDYGFYEGGGDTNPFRLDPLKLISVLTGKSVDQLKAIKV